MRYAIFFALFYATMFLPLQAQSINSLIEKAEDRLEHDDWIQAVKDFESILDKYGSSLTSSQKASIYNDLGYLNMRLLNAGDAEYYLNLSVLNHEEGQIPDKLGYAATLQNLSQFFLQRVQFDLAKSYIDQAIEIITAEQGQNNAEYALARTKLAQIFEEVGYYDLAFDIYTESHEVLKNLGAFSPDYAEACNHMGRILIRKGDPNKAEEFFNESTVIYEQLGKEYEVEHAESLEGLGNFYEQLGRYEEAEEILQQALTIKRSIPNEANILIIETLNDLGILYRHLGNEIKSEQMFKEVVTKCEEELSTDHPFYATAKNNLATIAMQKGDFKGAKVLLEEALKTYDDKYGPNHPLSSNTLNNLARVERQIGEPEVAEEYYKRVLQVDERLYGKQHPDYATTLINLAILYSASGKEDEAEKYYKEGLSIRKQVLGKDHPSYLAALENTGLHSIAVGKMEDAEQYFKEAIEIQIGQVQSIFPALNGPIQELFFERLREDVERYNFIALGLLDKNPELVKNIFDFEIKSRSILFSPADKITQRIMNGNDQLLRNQFYEWQQEKLRLASYYRMGVQQLAENNIDLGAIESDLKQKEGSLASKMVEFKSILPETTENWQSVQNAVGDDEAIVQVIKVREFKSQSNDDGIVFGFSNLTRYLAIVFTGDSDSPKHVLLGDKLTSDAALYAVYKASLLNRDPQNRAFDLLWKPVHDAVGGSKMVRFCPDGIFHKINPNIFKTSDQDFLIDQYFVTQLTSCKDLFRDESQTLTKRSLFFGNPDFQKSSSSNPLGIQPLPRAELEINAIGALLQPKNWEVRTYSKGDASELRMRSAFNPTILHIATHGFFADRQDFIASKSRYKSSYFKSGLYLAGASKAFTSYIDGTNASTLNDGILTAYEAMELDLNRTQLVVLSSCETQLDEIDNVDNFYGLQRAFMVAGARNLITSLSKTDDNAQNELMVLFYHKYMETENASESLRFAQNKLRTKYTDPKVWGSFILIGNG